MAIDRLHPFQQPQFDARHIRSLQRGRINGHKALQFLRKQFRIGLPHVAAHGLPHDHRLAQSFPAENLIQPSCLVHQGEGQTERPGSAMAGGVPYQQIVFSFETGNLFVKQLMVSGQPRQKNQGGWLRGRSHDSPSNESCHRALRRAFPAWLSPPAISAFIIQQTRGKHSPLEQNGQPSASVCTHKNQRRNLDTLHRFRRFAVGRTFSLR